MALSCRAAARASLAAMAEQAGDAERLELEAHLMSCRRCHEQHGTILAVVGGLKQAEPAPLTPEARDQVREALARRVPVIPHRSPRNRWRRRISVGTAVAAAAAAAVLVLSWRDRAYRVIDGDVAVGGLAPATDAIGDQAMVFRAARGGRVQLDDATVDLVGSTEITWNASRRRVDLRRGVVTVDVRHHAGRHWEIGTPRFTVEVVGTRFTVGPSGVSTQRGVVRVRRPDGSLAARVEAGESWSIDTSGTREAPVPVANPLHSVEAGTPAVPAPSLSPSAGTKESAGHGPVGPNPGRALADARRALARGDTAAARRMLTPLFHLGREIAAEARVIFAESFLVEGRYADAIDGYLLVVRDFPSTNQSESAEFAVAELEAEHGRTAEAVEALRKYLARHPHGRFVREASHRLQQLASSAPRDGK